MLKLANGNEESLRQKIEWAKWDYRDVLAPAEYPLYSKRGIGIGDLSPTEQKQIIDYDWQQYEQWLKR